VKKFILLAMVAFNLTFSSGVEADYKINLPTPQQIPSNPNAPLKCSESNNMFYCSVEFKVGVVAEHFTSYNMQNYLSFAPLELMKPDTFQGVQISQGQAEITPPLKRAYEACEKLIINSSASNREIHFGIAYNIVNVNVQNFSEKYFQKYQSGHFNWKVDLADPNIQQMSCYMQY